jgi:hypothetical protein
MISKLSNINKHYRQLHKNGSYRHSIVNGGGGGPIEDNPEYYEVIQNNGSTQSDDNSVQYTNTCFLLHYNNISLNYLEIKM